MPDFVLRSQFRRGPTSAVMAGSAAVLIVCLASDFRLAASTQKPQTSQKPRTTPSGEQSATAYFPPRGDWRQQTPDAVGMDRAAVDQAIAFAVANENPGSK